MSANGSFDEFAPTAREDALVVEELGDETLVYDLDRDKAHSLNRTAAAVWRNCDGQRDIAELTAVVGAELGHPISRDAIWRALSQLHERHLLEGELLQRLSGPEFSRRQALIRVGATGATVALAVPVVRSIIAPTPARAGAQQSCVQSSGQCGTFDGKGCNTTGFAQCCTSNPVLTCATSTQQPAQGDPCTCQQQQA